MKKILLSLTLSLFSIISYSQIIPPVGVASNHNLTSGQVTVFYDPSGAGGNSCTTGLVANGSYSNCACFTTITINAAAGEFLTISFNEFSMWNTTSGWDWMKIYDGPNTGSPVLYDNSSTGPDNPFGDCGINATVLDFCSLGNSMTFEFWATSVVNRAGWDATVSSVTTACTPLPIELEWFEGYNKNNINHIDWVTATEINNDYFTLERSRDAINWNEIGVLEGSGNSNTPIMYEYKDDSYDNGTNYYRLTQTDFDGKFESFEIISITTTNVNFLDYKVVNLLGQEMDDDINQHRVIIWSDNKSKFIPAGYRTPKRTN